MATGTKPEAKTAGSTEQFFDELSKRGQEPLLRRVTGTIRFDLGTGMNAEHWFVKVKKGKVDVSHGKGPADAVVRAEAPLFDEITAGKTNAMAAVLRGLILPEGDLGLVMTFQRLFPGPPRSRSKSRSRPARATKGTNP
jgi:putative sterol carrier protein